MFLHTLGQSSNSVITQHLKARRRIGSSVEIEDRTGESARRHAYKEDKERKWPAEVEVYIVDLQKVLLLPKVTTKDSFFISRLVTFNETFAPLHKGDNKCHIWQLSEGEMLMTLSQHWVPHNIIVNYFEPGNSFMKADSVYGQIGREWRKRSQILDFNDFSDVVIASATKNKPIALHHDDFCPLSNCSKQRRRNAAGETNVSLLEQIKRAEFRKKQLGKKTKIINELCASMESRKQLFWRQLPINDDVHDLLYQ
nr:unnamed protein product [Callosobruchus analis]